MDTSKTGTLPSLIIIGAGKCGTTSLHYYLGLHPQISMAWEKELNFFIKEINWYKGIEWYKSKFSGPAKIHGEASPSYTSCPLFKGVPERIYSVVPKSKLLYIVKDPVARIISHYINYYALGKEARGINEVLTEFKNNPYVSKSKYFFQLEQYLKYFPESNIKIITLENLISNPQQTMGGIFKFLEVDESFYSSKFLSAKNRSTTQREKTKTGLALKHMYESSIGILLPKYARIGIGRFLSIPFSRKIETPTLDPQLRKDLIDYLKEDIDSLRKFTGFEFKEWCI